MKDTLRTIFKKIQYKDSMGIDGISVQKYAKILKEEIEIIERKIEDGTYNFSFYRRKLVEKSPENFREISIPTVRDKIVLKYINQSLHDSFQDELSNDRTAQLMVEEIIRVRNDFECFIKIDVQNFFPSIDHELLLKLIASKVADSNMLELIKKAITQSTVAMSTPKSLRVPYDNTVGVPQGLSISGTLASIYISSIIQKYAYRKDIKLYKFVDDILILCDENAVESIQMELDAEFASKKLTVHRYDAASDKSSVGRISQRFEYLGYLFNGDNISVREKSVQKMVKNLTKEFTKYKYGTLSLKQLYETVNIKIAGCATHSKKYGWINFYAQINDQTLLKKLDRIVAKQCEQVGISYDEKIKKFSRAYFEIKEDESNYIPRLDRYSQEKQYQIVAELKDDMQIY